MGENNTSLHLLTLACDLTSEQFGAEHLTTAQSLHQLTQAKFLVGDIPGAATTSQQALDIFKARLGEDHAQTKEVGRNVELLKAVMDNVERQKVANEAQKKAAAERLQSAQARVGGLARFRRLGATPAATGAAATATANGTAVAANPDATATGQAESSAAGAATAAEKSVEELVRFIDGSGAKVSRGKNALRGKRRTGAKR
jgi:protein TIF31